MADTHCPADAERELRDKEKCPGCFGELPKFRPPALTFGDIGSDDFDKLSYISSKRFRQREGLKAIPFPCVGAFYHAFKGTWWVVAWKLEPLLKKGVVLSCFGAFLEQPILQQQAETGDMVVQRMAPGETCLIPWGWNTLLCCVASPQDADASNTPQRATASEKKDKPEFIGHALHVPVFNKKCATGVAPAAMKALDSSLTEFLEKQAARHEFSADCLAKWTQFKTSLEAVP